ncbi:hypothetical protein U9R90_06395 [Streptomyces sp. E11-3]|uniref:hypothetical protein n=1 Tax=Streptomyces sp. E11-3 TaxID=3110112 RepID=UPI00397EBA10
MSNSHTYRTYGAIRTGKLWATAAVLFFVLLGSLALCVFDSLEFDERCAQGMVEGPGRLQDTRQQSFPPAVICEFEHGVVSAGGTGLLGAVTWLSLAGLAMCVLLALLAECVELPAGPRAPLLISRAERTRRTGTALFVTGSAFLMVYGLFGWRLLAGPSSACSAGAEWGTFPPETLEYRLFPPQATCMAHSGRTWHLNGDWGEALATASAVYLAVAGAGFALAWRRRRAEVRGAGGRGVP